MAAVFESVGSAVELEVGLVYRFPSQKEIWLAFILG